MYVISSFEYSAYLELAISELELNNICRKRILAIPLGKKTEKRRIWDNINQSDGISLIDTATILGSVFMVFGVIYGYILKWGPILWGLIGLISGFVLGLIIDVVPKQKNKRSQKKSGNQTTDVILIIQCDQFEVDTIENVLMRNFAIGIGRFVNGI